MGRPSTGSRTTDPFRIRSTPEARAGQRLLPLALGLTTSLTELAASEALVAPRRASGSRELLVSGLPPEFERHPARRATARNQRPQQLPTAMIPPISTQSAGSGGGGGGDHIEAAGTPPNNDDQGGGGGGGGGGFRISCGGAYLHGGTGQINASGINGGNASNASGAGGSGSGGQVWIQAFGSTNFNPTALIAVVGAARLFPSAGLIGCSAQASGGGGHGLVQVNPVPDPRRDRSTSSRLRHRRPAPCTATRRSSTRAAS